MWGREKHKTMALILMQKWKYNGLVKKTDQRITLETKLTYTTFFKCDACFLSNLKYVSENVICICFDFITTNCLSVFF